MSLTFDILGCILLTAISVLMFLLGTRYFRWTRRGQWLWIVLLALLAIPPVLYVLQWLPARAMEAVSLWGGIVTLGIVPVLGLCGINYVHSTSSLGFRRFLLLFPLFLLWLQIGGRFYLGSMRAAAWQRFPDAQSRLSQSTPFTCAPCAAAMLLDRHGIRVSEGEMIYRCKTSLLGTHDYAVAGALRPLVEARGWTPVVFSCTLDELRVKSLPCIVNVKIGRDHAVLCIAMDDEAVIVLDPNGGEERRWAWDEFRGKWIGTGLELRR